MSEALNHANETRQRVIDTTDVTVREKFAQHLTPFATAVYATSMFSDANAAFLRCLDLGGGTGILSVAMFERYGQAMEVDVVEVDPAMCAVCESELSAYGISCRLHRADAVCWSYQPVYDRVILNPPYKKMVASDARQKLLHIPRNFERASI